MAVARDLPGALHIRGYVYDGAGAPVTDSLSRPGRPTHTAASPISTVTAGRPRSTGFRGFARCAHEHGDGSFAIRTVKPGPVPAPDGVTQAPHIDVSVFARGLLHRCVTRIYFADERAANAADPVLMSVPAARRHTLLAAPIDDGYRFDVHLQGLNETVFFAL